MRRRARLTRGEHRRGAARPARASSASRSPTAIGLLATRRRSRARSRTTACGGCAWGAAARSLRVAPVRERGAPTSLRSCTTSGSSSHTIAATTSRPTAQPRRTELLIRRWGEDGARADRAAHAIRDRWDGPEREDDVESLLLAYGRTSVDVDGGALQEFRPGHPRRRRPRQRPATASRQPVHPSSIEKQAAAKPWCHLGPPPPNPALFAARAFPPPPPPTRGVECPRRAGDGRLATGRGIDHLRVTGGFRAEGDDHGGADDACVWTTTRESTCRASRRERPFRASAELSIFFLPFRRAHSGYGRLSGRHSRGWGGAAAGRTRTSAAGETGDER